MHLRVQRRFLSICSVRSLRQSGEGCSRPKFSSCIRIPLTALSLHPLSTSHFLLACILLLSCSSPRQPMILFIFGCQSPPLQHVLRSHLIYRVSICEIPPTILPYISPLNIHPLSESQRCRWEGNTLIHIRASIISQTSPELSGKHLPASQNLWKLF